LRQRELLGALRDLQAKSEKPLMWGPPELRRIARELGMKRQTAQETCAAVAAFYLTPCAFGGYRLPDSVLSKMSKKSESGQPDTVSKKPPEGGFDGPGIGHDGGSD
jgi:hypothetical protein